MLEYKKRKILVFKFYKGLSFAVAMMLLIPIKAKGSYMSVNVDDQGIRYRLVQKNAGIYNWLFMPGGPGADSCYFLSLIKLLDLPGSVWLIDLPGGGDNKVSQPYDYRAWFNLVVPMVKRFKHPIIVGHSFGAMIPLMCPELETLLDGFVALNSAPSLWFDQSIQARKKLNIPDLPEKQLFLDNQSDETFSRLMSAQLPYFFVPHALEKGREMFSSFTYSYQVALALQAILKEMLYDAKWIPQHVKMLIIGGERDYICPHSVFSEDVRFNRQNIKQVEIKGAGHWPWIEQPDVVRSLFDQFCVDLCC